MSDVTAGEAERASRSAEATGDLVLAAAWAVRAAEEHARAGAFLIALSWCKTAVRLDRTWLEVWSAFERTVGREEWTAEHILTVAAAALEETGRSELAAAMRGRLGR